MRVLCWNINALAPTVQNVVLRWGSFKGLFQEYEADIACFQSFWAISQDRKGYSGVVTYASTGYAPLACEADCLGEEELDREGRLVVTDHGSFVLLNVYVPNAGDRPARARLDCKIRFLRALKAKCDGLVAGGRQVLLVGDFNVAAAPQDVHPTMNYDELYTLEERGAMLAFFKGYTDVWRRLHPDTTDVYSVWDEYTSARAFNRGLRIDYFLCTPGLLEKVVSCEMVATHPKWSDHTGMVLELRDIQPLPPHPPCPQWTTLQRRFVDTSQRSLAAMFGKKQQQQPKSVLKQGEEKAAAAAQADKQQKQQQQQEGVGQQQQQQEEEIKGKQQQQEGEEVKEQQQRHCQTANGQRPQQEGRESQQRGRTHGRGVHQRSHAPEAGADSTGQQLANTAAQRATGAGCTVEAAKEVREAAVAGGAQPPDSSAAARATSAHEVSGQAQEADPSQAAGAAAPAGGGTGRGARAAGSKRKAAGGAGRGGGGGGVNGKRGGRGGGGGGGAAAGQRSIAAFFAASSQGKDD
ncbi:hypothetical protein N2152v2_005393 [Parachlorella kessleri]